MLFLSGLDPYDLLMERKFGVRHLKPDEYRFVPEKCA